MLFTHKAGETIRYRVTWLDMRQRPTWGWPPLPLGQEAMLLRADTPPWWYFLSLYDAVGRDYAWTDKHQMAHDDMDAWLAHPDVSLFSLLVQGWPQGFFMLDWRDPEACDLAYFGLVPQALGKGLGTWLLKTAILTGWAREGTRALTVNTCTLDHPRALIQYQRAGFAPVRTETQTRRLTRDQIFQQPLL